MMTPERREEVINCLEHGICDGVPTLTSSELLELVADSWDEE